MMRIWIRLLGFLFVCLFFISCLLAAPGRTVLSEKFLRYHLLPELLRLLERPLAAETRERIDLAFSRDLLEDDEIRGMIRKTFTAEAIWPDVRQLLGQFRTPQPLGQRVLVLKIPDDFKSMHGCLKDFGVLLRDRLLPSLQGDALAVGQMKRFMNHYDPVHPWESRIDRVTESVFTIPVFSLLAINIQYRTLVCAGLLFITLIPLILVIYLKRKTPATAVVQTGWILLATVVIILLLTGGLELLIRLPGRSQTNDFRDMLNAGAPLLRSFWWTIFGQPAYYCLGGFLLSVFVTRQGLVTDPIQVESEHGDPASEDGSCV